MSSALCRTLRTTWPALLAGALTATTQTGPARACSVCGCDPAASTLGLERPAPSALRLAVEGRYSWKESGTGDDREGEREDRAVLRVQGSVLPSLVLQGELPFYLWKSHLDAAGAVDDTAHGLGDALLGARWELYRDHAIAPRHVLALVGSVKLPTGPSDRPSSPPSGLQLAGGLRTRGALVARQPDGAVPAIDEHLQLGSGSFDGLLAAWYNASLRETTTAYATAGVRLNSRNERDFRYGNVFQAGAGVREKLLDSRKLALSLEAQVRSAGYDLYGDGSRDPDSGGLVGYATLGAWWAIGDSLFLRAAVQLPVVQQLHGVQTEHPAVFGGVGYDFGF